MELNAILCLSSSSFSNPRSMTAQRLAGWQFAPHTISGSEFSLRIPGSEFCEIKYSMFSAKEPGFVIETGQAIPGRPVRQTHLPFSR